MRKNCLFIYFLFSATCVLQAAENKLVVKYGQNLNVINTFDKDGNIFSKTNFVFEQDLLKATTVETETEIHTYNYSQEEGYYLEEYILVEKDKFSENTINRTRKVLEENPYKKAQYNYVWENDEWTKQNSVVSTYSNKLLTRFEELKGLNNNWITSRRVDYYYYPTESRISDGKLKEVYSFADGEISSKTEYLYTPVGGVACLLSETVYGLNNLGFFQRCMQTNYFYPSNNQEQIILDISYYNLETNALVGKEKHSLSKQSGVLDTYQIQIFDNANNPVRLIENDYSYQNNNQIAVEKSVVSDLVVEGTETKLSRFSTAGFDSKSVRVLQETFDEEKWNKKEELLVIYDNKGHLFKNEIIKYVSPDFVGVPVYKTEWSYDPDTKVDVCHIYAYDELSSRMVPKWLFALSYGEETNPNDVNDPTEIKTQNAFFIYPNPASENIFISADFDFSAPVQYFIYNLTGKLQKRGFIHSSQEAIPVAELSSGNYLLRLAKDGGEYTTCVFIKL